MKVNKQMIKEYLGSDHLSVDELLGVLEELANGEWTIEDFKSNVEDYAKENAE